MMLLYLPLSLVSLLAVIANTCTAHPGLRELVEQDYNRRGRDQFPIRGNVIPSTHPIYIYQWLQANGNIYRMYGLNEIHHPLGVWNRYESFGAKGEKLKEALLARTCISEFEMRNVTSNQKILHDNGYEWILQWSQGCDRGDWLALVRMTKTDEAETNNKKRIFPLVEVLAQLRVPFDWVYGTTVNFSLYASLYYFHDNSMPYDGHSPIKDSTMAKYDFRKGAGYIPPMKRLCGEKRLIRDESLCVEHYNRGCNMPWGFCRKERNDPRIQQFLEQQVANGNLTYARRKSPLESR